MKKSEIILEELSNGKALSYAFAGANFAVFIALVTKSETSSRDAFGVASTLAGIFSMILMALFLTLCHSRKRLPQSFGKLGRIFVVIGMWGFFSGVDTLTRPIDEKIKYVAAALLVGSVFAARYLKQETECGKLISLADDDKAESP